MTSILNPPLYDALGEVVPLRSDDSVEAYQPGVDHPYATGQLAPLGWDQGHADNSRMVGWTLHNKGQSGIVAEHAFSINPQSITRTDSPRNSLFATQGSFYVDDFGSGATQLQISQLVAHGRAFVNVGGGHLRATAREDVLRFYDAIYVAATANPGKYDVYFHDNHLWNVIDGKSPERVYFPPNSCQLVRSVQLQNVWQLQLSMTCLDAPPAAATDPTQVPGQPKIKVHVVRRGETLLHIAGKLAGSKATHSRLLQIQQQIIALTRKYGSDDITKTRTILTYSPTNAQTWTGQIKVSRMHVAPGEKIILPA